MPNYQSVKLLNLPDKSSPATIVTKLVTEDAYKNYVIELTDCEKRVHLHGGMKNPTSRENSIVKMQTIIDEMTALRNKTIDHYKDAKKLYNKKRLLERFPHLKEIL